MTSNDLYYELLQISDGQSSLLELFAQDQIANIQLSFESGLSARDQSDLSLPALSREQNSTF